MTIHLVIMDIQYMTIYDNIYNGFYYTWNKASGESTFLITRMKGGEPPQAFMLDDTDTKGIEVD